LGPTMPPGVVSGVQNPSRFSSAVTLNVFFPTGPRLFHACIVTRWVPGASHKRPNISDWFHARYCSFPSSYTAMAVTLHCRPASAAASNTTGCACTLVSPGVGRITLITGAWQATCERTMKPAGLCIVAPARLLDEMSAEYIPGENTNCAFGRYPVAPKACAVSLPFTVMSVSTSGEVSERTIPLIHTGESIGEVDCGAHGHT